MNKGAYWHILFVFFLMIVFTLAGNLLAMLLWSLSGNPAEEILNATNLDPVDRNLFRLVLITNHFFTFLAPALFFGYILYNRDFIQYLKLKTPLKIQMILLWGLIILASYPLVGFLTKLNVEIPFPDWVLSSQEDAFRILSNVLRMESPWELLLTLTLVGILPALGEEIVFRGIIQQKFMEVIRNPHLAILISSVLFGAVHMQFERILPLSFLGLLLGYSFYYTRSLWVPVLLHFLNNSLQVVSFFYSNDVSTEEIQKLPEIPTGILIASIIFTLGLLYSGIRYSEKLYEIRS